METTPTCLLQDEPPKYKKVVLKKGNKINYPQKGEVVKVYYKGTLENGTVFDTNIHRQSSKPVM